MKLNLEELKNIATGAVNVTENEDGITFHRFYDKQEKYYEIDQPERSFYDRCLATAGIRLMFKTDSKTLKIKGVIEKGTSRNYYSFEVFVNGECIGNIDNFSGCELPENYTEAELPLGEFSGEFLLGEGTKEVSVYFPWSVRPTLKEISVDDGAFLKPIKRAKKLLAFGDSITQGYDALRPSMRYVSRLADKLGAEEINKGIGGEFFVPGLAKLTEEYVPDYITVAYGTNDWSKKPREDFNVRCREFYETLSKNYPETKIFAISPIWRADHIEEREFGLFEDVENYIKDVVADLENVIFISGLDFVEHDIKFYADFRLHPNDEGFRHYSDNLYEQIQKFM